jgi:hypothetical protein
VVYQETVVNSEHWTVDPKVEGLSPFGLAGALLVAKARKAFFDYKS